MSNIQIFNFQDNNQFPVKILIQDNKEYFLAKNVCDILELANVSQALSRLEKDDIISNDTTDSLGRIQKMSYVSEAGLYELVFASKKPEAKEFKKWVFNTILPTIRKTGKFEIQQLSKLEILQMALESEKMVLQLQNTVKEKDNVIEAQENIIDEFITISNTKNYTQVGKILHQKPLQFIQWLRDNKYIRQNREPYQQYLDMKLFVIKTPKTEQKHREPSYHITPKGFEYFRKKLVEKKPAELNK